MQNMNLFEMLGVESDPVYRMVADLQTGESIEVDGINVCLHKYYEIENDIEHTAFTSVTGCYRHLSNMIVKQSEGKI